MEFQLRLTRKAEKALDNFDEALCLKIVYALREIQKEPFWGKKLTGKKKGQYSVRVWPYRIIYRIEKSQLVVIVIDIDHRQGVYKK